VTEIYLGLSKRFAPGGWTQSTRDEKINVLQRYLPFWNESLHGSISGSLRVDVSQLQQVCLLSSLFSSHCDLCR
jgi:hypothetical protein